MIFYFSISFPVLSWLESCIHSIFLSSSLYTSGFISLEILMANQSLHQEQPSIFFFLTSSTSEQNYKWNLLMVDEFWLDSTYSFDGQLLLSSQTTSLWSNGFQKVWEKTDVFPRMQFLWYCGKQKFLDVQSRKSFKILFGWFSSRRLPCLPINKNLTRLIAKMFGFSARKQWFGCESLTTHRNA